ncbi:MAG: Ig-like domain-containing protein, partial [Candidatus Neomarinimicrobiota bacterium]
HIEVTATDPHGAVARDTMVLVILPVNDPPLLAKIPPLQMNEDAPRVIPLTAIDIENDALAFSASSDTAGVSLEIVDTTMTITPAANWSGTATIILSVTDGEATDLDTFAVTVNPVNDAPTAFELLAPDSGNSMVLDENDPDSTISFTWEHSRDPDGEEVSYLFVIWQEEGDFEISHTLTEPELNLLRDPVIAYMRERNVTKLTFFWEVGAISGSDITWNTAGENSLEIEIGSLAVADNAHLPQMFVLHQNYPNPFNPVTTLHYELPMQAHVQLMIYDIRGREVVRLVDRYEGAGFKRVAWNSSDASGRPVPSGLYFARIVTPEYAHIIKMTLIR